MRLALVAALVVVALVVAALMVYVRFAPANAARWHQRPGVVAADLRLPLPTDGPQAMPGGAYAALVSDQSRVDLLTRLDAIALSTPRTRRIAGTPQSGMITWETRSAVWGFPDYTTAEATSDAAHGTVLAVVARLRFGASDLGVNGARLGLWLARLSEQ